MTDPETVEHAMPIVKKSGWALLNSDFILLDEPVAQQVISIIDEDKKRRHALDVLPHADPTHVAAAKRIERASTEFRNWFIFQHETAVKTRLTVTCAEAVSMFLSSECDVTQTRRGSRTGKLRARLTRNAPGRQETN